MDKVRLKLSLMAVIEKGLKDCSSPINYAIVERKIETLSDDPEEILKTLGKIRVVIRLFIDETLADDIYQELLAIVHSTIPSTRSSKGKRSGPPSAGA